MKRKVEAEGCSDSSQADYISHARYIEIRKAPLDQDEEIEKKKFKSNLIEVMDEIISNYPPTNKNGEKDFSIYTGTCGVHFFFSKLNKLTTGDKLKDIPEDYFKFSNQYLECSLYGIGKQRTSSERYTYYCGSSGVLTNNIMNSNKDKDTSSSLKTLLSYSPTVINPQFSSNEALYGRVGYLASLLPIWRKDNSKIPIDVIESVVKVIIRNGKALGGHGKFQDCPLMWMWHNKKYWGAAHGATGILFLLLGVFNEVIVNLGEEVVSDICGTIDYLISQFLLNPESSFPTRNEGNTELVQWCHGSPGLILLLCRAYDIFGTQRYLDIAIAAEKVVWEQGFLKKGPGLCHGISGNAYVLLALYKRTQNKNYLLKAKHFVSSYFDLKDRNSSIFDAPDRPYSLYEGSAGMGCLLLDLLSFNEDNEGESLFSFPSYGDL